MIDVIWTVLAWLQLGLLVGFALCIGALAMIWARP